MNFKQLYYFTVIVETGSISAAAVKLDLSQPPLSRQLLQLEESLGTPLLKRGAHGIELTGAGQLLYYRAKDILSMLDTTAMEVRSYSDGLAGTLKIGCISSSGILMTQLMSAFIDKYPLITVDLYEGNTYETIEKLKNGFIECAIIRTPFNTEGLSCIYGPEEPLMAVGQPRFFDRPDAVGVKLPQLLGRPLIYYRRFENMIAHAFQNAGLKPQILCKNDDARTSLQWAAEGLGVALVPENISRLAQPDNGHWKQAVGTIAPSVCSETKPEHPLFQTECEPTQSKRLIAQPILCDELVTRMTAVCLERDKKTGRLSQVAQNFLDVFQEVASDK